VSVHRWEESGFEQLTSSISRQAAHGETMTVARFRLRKGTIVEQHQHVNEQIATVLSGRMKFVLGDGSEHVVDAGETIVLPPNVPHAAEVLEDSEVLDAFSPVREDWIRGEDAYLRR
jgi:quercetin dioxygenase-like cupin family protein